jgi:hypothetical protein
MKICDKYGMKEEDRDFLCLIVFLIKEKRKENTPFKAWLESLPKSFAEHPLMIKEKDLQILNNTMALEDINFGKQQMTENIQYLKKILKDLDISESELKTTYLQVSTRVFWEKHSDSRTISPYADFFNTHTSEKVNVDWKFDNRTGDHLFSANKNIKKGEEFFDLYSTEWSNTEFFLNWGLTVNETSKSFIHFPILIVRMGNKKCKFVLSYPAIRLKAKHKNNSCLQVEKDKRQKIIKAILKNLESRYSSIDARVKVDIFK